MSRTLLSLRFRPRYLWVGVHVLAPSVGLTRHGRQYREQALLVCVLPMLALIVRRREVD